MLYNQSGEENGVMWSTEQIGARKFKIRVGDAERIYETMYPTLFGLDVYDVDQMNMILDEMFAARGGEENEGKSVVH